MSKNCRPTWPGPGNGCAITAAACCGITKHCRNASGPPSLRARQRAGGGGARSWLSSQRRAEGETKSRRTIRSESCRRLLAAFRAAPAEALCRRNGLRGRNRWRRWRISRIGHQFTSHQRPHRQALFRAFHESVEDMGRKPAAGRLFHRRGIVIADPHAAHQIGGEADKPGIVEILGGAGLAGGRPLGQPRRLAGAGRSRSAPSAGHRGIVGGRHHRARSAELALIEDLSRPVADADDGDRA